MRLWRAVRILVYAESDINQNPYRCPDRFLVLKAIVIRRQVVLWVCIYHQYRMLHESDGEGD